MTQRQKHFRLVLDVKEKSVEGAEAYLKDKLADLIINPKKVKMISIHEHINLKGTRI